MFDKLKESMIMEVRDEIDNALIGGLPADFTNYNEVFKAEVKTGDHMTSFLCVSSPTGFRAFPMKKDKLDIIPTVVFNSGNSILFMCMREGKIYFFDSMQNIILDLGEKHIEFLDKVFEKILVEEGCILPMVMLFDDKICFYTDDDNGISFGFESMNIERNFLSIPKSTFRLKNVVEEIKPFAIKRDENGNVVK